LTINIICDIINFSLRLCLKCSDGVRRAVQTEKFIYKYYYISNQERELALIVLLIYLIVICIRDLVEFIKINLVIL